MISSENEIEYMGWLYFFEKVIIENYKKTDFFVKRKTNPVNTLNNIFQICKKRLKIYLSGNNV